MKNYERIKNMTIEEMAVEIKLIANWDRKEKSKANKDPNFYINWLNAESQIILKGVLDKKICDIEENTTNTQTYREFIRETEDGFGIEPSDIDSMDELWEK